MDRSLKWRTFWLIADRLSLCVGIARADLVAGHEAAHVVQLTPFEQEDQLGLDLQGGLHIVYSIDLDTRGRRQGVRDQARPRRAARGRQDQGAWSDAARARSARSTSRSTTRPKRPRSTAKITWPTTTSTIVSRRVPGRRRRPNSICFRVSSALRRQHQEVGARPTRSTRSASASTRRASPSRASSRRATTSSSSCPGLDEDVIETRDIIARTAKLEFKVVDNG